MDTGQCHPVQLCLGCALGARPEGGLGVCDAGLQAVWSSVRFCRSQPRPLPSWFGLIFGLCPPGRLGSPGEMQLSLSPAGTRAYPSLARRHSHTWLHTDVSWSLTLPSRYFIISSSTAFSTR